MLNDEEVLYTEENFDEPEPERRKRSPWTWPLVALILLVLFALVGFLISQSGLLLTQQRAERVRCLHAQPELNRPEPVR